MRVVSFDGVALDLTSLVKSFDISIQSSLDLQRCTDFFPDFKPSVSQELKFQLIAQNIDAVKKILPHQNAVRITIPRKHWFDVQYSFDAQVSNFEIFLSGSYSYIFTSSQWKIDYDKGYLARFMRWVMRREKAAVRIGA